MLLISIVLISSVGILSVIIFRHLEIQSGEVVVVKIVNRKSPLLVLDKVFWEFNRWFCEKVFDGRKFKWLTTWLQKVFVLTSDKILEVVFSYRKDVDKKASSVFLKDMVSSNAKFTSNSRNGKKVNRDKENKAE